MTMGVIMKANFKKYKYYYNGWIARMDKKTGKSELFVKGEWKPTEFVHGLDLLAGASNSDVMQLDVNSSQFLEALLNKKIHDKKTL